MRSEFQLVVSNQSIQYFRSQLFKQLGEILTK